MNFRDNTFKKIQENYEKKRKACFERFSFFASTKAGVVGGIVLLEAIAVLIFGYYSPDKVKLLIGASNKAELLSSLDPRNALKDARTYIDDILVSLSTDERIESANIVLNMKAISKLSCGTKRMARCSKGWSKGEVYIGNSDKPYSIRLRSKGDRDIHYGSLKSMSFLVKYKEDGSLDLDDQSLPFGMSRFSLMRPVTRGYDYEVFAAKIYRGLGIPAPKHRLIKLSINGEYVGLRLVEQSIDKDFLEVNGLRAGVVIDSGRNSPQVLGSKLAKAFSSGNPELEKSIDTSPDNIHVSFRDPVLWGRFLAISDVLSTTHAIQPKNVKHYINPTTKLTEPIYFDGHFNFILDKAFLFRLVFKPSDLETCKSEAEIIRAMHVFNICSNFEWLRDFFGETLTPRVELLKSYYDTLEEISGENFVESILLPSWDSLSSFRGHLYRSFARGENFFAETPLLYIGRLSKLHERIRLAREYSNLAKQFPEVIERESSSRVVTLLNRKSPLPQLVSVSCQYKVHPMYVLLPQHKRVSLDLATIDECRNSNSFAISPYGNSESRRLNGGTLVHSSKKLISKQPELIKDNIVFRSGADYALESSSISRKDVIFESGAKLCLLPGATLRIESSRVFIGNQDSTLPVDFSSCISQDENHNPGSIDFIKSNLVVKKAVFRGLGAKVRSAKELIHAGVNVINSSISFDSIIVESSHSEDAINFVHSTVNGGRLTVKNAFSDSIDLDSSTATFGSITCLRSGNDCLDLSHSNVHVSTLFSSASEDKSLSAGERSIVFIDTMISKSDEMAVTVKDSSTAHIRKLEIRDSRLPIAVYSKKPEYQSSTLIVEILKGLRQTAKNIYISNRSLVKINNKIIPGRYSSKFIMSKLYGEVYGKKSVGR